MPERDVISELSVDQFKAVTAQLGKGESLVVRFTAPWCRPCRRIEPLCHRRFTELPSTCAIAELDIEDTLDLYSAFTRAKMLKGVPAMLLFRGGVSRDKWFIPDDSVSGADPAEVGAFFDRCAQ